MALKPGIAVAVSIAFSTVGCTSSQMVTDSGCKSFRPIAGSKADTTDTKRQIVGHNRAFDAICPQPVKTS